MAEELDVLLVAEALVVGVGWDELRAPYTPLAADLPYTQSAIVPQSVAVSWAQYLASPVNVALVSMALDPSRPQTNIIARNPELHSVTDEVGEGNA